MEFSAKQIAELLQADIEGDPEVRVNRLAKIEEGEPGSLSFLANPKYTPFIYTTGADIVIVSQDFKAEQTIHATLLRVKDAYAAFARLLEVYQQALKKRTGISERAYLAETAVYGEKLYAGEFAWIGEGVRIGKHVQIFPHVYVGDHVVIGDHTILHPGVKVLHDCVIGSHCILHAGAVIGADGFGFAPNTGQQYDKVPQTGNVVLEDHVEIGANTCIDRATLGSTRIRKGVKLDNLIQVAHNVDIGENTVIAAQSGIAGSTRIGAACMIGGQVGIVGHISIADGVKLAAQSGIEGNVRQEGAILLGSPAIEIGNYRRSFIHFKNLQQLVKRVEALEKLIPEK
ncbi:MAG TPA: UDP-3-O-(3-hydroxymyristoyl)glucosamine N-acyltransferase [Bacteroidales bacterium]|nr:UDP-3-O-(3-hydroxymyristoyl)glucosamine N-acyltransferase [Bacteroidales bacterium]HSA43624.1 UDP-3-O-(3-hydroxymyristoyl)glucosamine N-acyltransferase [Bacteroidales bacterium]